MKKVLFAISSLGLGHATRSLFIINYLLKKNYKITILSHGNSLNFLKSELLSDSLSFVDFIDYPPLERGKGIMFYFYLFIDLIRTSIIIRKERKYIKLNENNFDIIFSDGRYGIYSKKIKSFLISHQISFVMPKYLGFFQFILDFFNFRFFKNFTSILIPDFEDEKNNLAGKLSHSKILNKLNHKYLGLLSSYEKLGDCNNQIDYLFIISGYLQEHKDNFVNKLLEQAKLLDGKKVFILGDLSIKKIDFLEEYNIEIYSYLSGIERQEMFRKSNIIISRSGYTTIMDLIKLGKKAVLFPTPNQTEQEYLSFYLEKQGYFISGNQDNFNLKNLIEKINKCRNFKLNNFEKIEFILNKLIK